MSFSITTTRQQQHQPHLHLQMYLLVLSSFFFLLFLFPFGLAQLLLPFTSSSSSSSLPTARRNCRCAPPLPNGDDGDDGTAAQQQQLAATTPSLLVPLPFAAPPHARAYHNRNYQQQQQMQESNNNNNNDNNNNVLGNALLKMSEQLLLAPFAMGQERKKSTLTANGNNGMPTLPMVNAGRNNSSKKKKKAKARAGKGGVGGNAAGKVHQVMNNRPKRQTAGEGGGKEKSNDSNNKNVIDQPVAPALAVPDGGKCNSERIRHIIKKARGRNSGALKRNIQALAERSLGARFNVVCARSDFSYISNTEEFCQERVHGNTCYVFKQIARDLPFPEPPELNQFVRGFGAINQPENNNGLHNKRRHKKKATVKTAATDDNAVI